MIQTEFGREPGSYVPVKPKKYAGTTEPANRVKALIDTYIQTAGWEQGTGILVRGGYASHKTTTGLYVLRRIAEVDDRPQHYWTESDYLSDLRELWSLKEQLPRGINDADLWQDYVEWEHRFESLKASPILFLDNLGFGYSQNHKYEVFNFVRQRADRALPTIVAVGDAEWDSLPPALQSLLRTDNLTVRVG